MAIEREFQDMLNENLSESLMNNEFERRCYAYNKMEHNKTWKGGVLPVPIQGATASSMKFGGYTAENDLSFDNYLRGQLTGYKTLTYSLPFRHRDIIEHNGRVKKDSFLKVLTSNMENAMDFLKNAVSINLLNGGWYDKVAIDGTALGVLGVANPYRFQIGQKVKVGAAGAITGYVREIDINAKTITLFDAREGGAVVDVSAATVAGSNKIYLDGQEAEAFFSVREALLPDSLGGSDTIHGLTKSDNPYLQAKRVNGSTITSATLGDRLFDALTEIKQDAGVTANLEAVMGWKAFGAVMKRLESSKVAFRVKEGSRKDMLYGITEIELSSVTNGQNLKLVGIPECDSDVIFMIDWSTFTFHSNGGFRKVKTPDGLEFYTVRSTTGYTYICDIELYGDITCNRPHGNGVIHSISL